MKFLVLFGVLLIVVFAEEDKYTDKYDNIDLDEILNSQRLLENYYNCLLDKGPCTPDGKELKETIPDALQSECSKCSEIQKQRVEKVLLHLKEKEKVKWAALEKKYDPEGHYEARYQEKQKKLKE